MAGFDPARLNGVPLTQAKIEGIRNQAPGFDPRSGEGARRNGGRFNPPRSFPVVYLCTTMPCVVAELQRAAERQSLQVGDLLPREVWSIEAHLERVLDLTDHVTLEAARLQRDELIRPDDHGFTQQIGEAAHERGLQCVRAPSATGVGDVLALFTENLGAVVLEVRQVVTWTEPQDVKA